jgi:hypothetical protein
MEIDRHVHRELQLAVYREDAGDPVAAFRHLERAHILGQHSTRLHVLAHWHMLGWAWRRRDGGELAGQLFRLVGAVTKTAVGLVPAGNSGGANVSPFKRMPIPDDLAEILKAHR